MAIGEFELANAEYTGNDPEMKRLAEMSAHLEQEERMVCAENPAEIPGLLRRRGGPPATAVMNVAISAIQIASVRLLLCLTKR
jgi:hypothetical protein